MAYPPFIIITSADGIINIRDEKTGSSYRKGGVESNTRLKQLPWRRGIYTNSISLYF